MKTTELRSSPTYKVSEEDYAEYINSLQDMKKSCLKLDILKDDTTLAILQEKATNIFSEYINKITAELKDPKTGIIALDIPSNYNLSPNEDAFWGILAVMGIGANIFTPVRESLNKTPFTVYTASKENEEKLTEAGLNFYSPKHKLGFHNDGLLRGDALYIPHHIMIYNVSIAYNKPGNFYWIPFSLWQKKEYYAEKIPNGQEYTFKLTPIVYPGKEGNLELRGKQEINAPLFVKDSEGRDVLFMNGEVIGMAHGSQFDERFVSDLKASLSSNPIRLIVAQKERRVIFLNNCSGCHARDIFEEPIPGTKYTRTFLRSVDKQGLEVKDG